MTIPAQLGSGVKCWEQLLTLTIKTLGSHQPLEQSLVSTPACLCSRKHRTSWTFYQPDSFCMCQSRVRAKRGPTHSQAVNSNRTRGDQSSAFLKFLCRAPFMSNSSWLLPTSRGNCRGLRLHLSLTQTGAGSRTVGRTRALVLEQRLDPLWL